MFYTNVNDKPIPSKLLEHDYSHAATGKNPLR